MYEDLINKVYPCKALSTKEFMRHLDFKLERIHVTWMEIRGYSSELVCALGLEAIDSSIKFTLCRQ